MKTEDHSLFNHLKQAVSNTFLQNHSASTALEDWKGEDIVEFQEDLLQKVKGTVSEKWFYTYIKNDPEKLPRIDMLNLLSKYAGYKNWNDFKNSYATVTSESGQRLPFKKYLGFLLLLIASVFIYYTLNAKNNFSFCFVDDTEGTPIKSYLDIKILKDIESPIYLKTDSLGCFSYTSKENMIRFVVQSPYYKTDTIVRSINTIGTTSTINLNTDDYALMLQYYSNGNLKDWKKRKAQLQKMIANDAQIYQIFPGNVGIELYTKNDFISKLTVPTASLKNIKILEKSYEQGKIVKIKFMIK